MSDFDAVIESDVPVDPVDSSSDDLRSALQAATREVSDRMRDEQGRFAKGEKAPVEKPAETPAPVDKTPAAEPAPVVDPAAPKVETPATEPAARAPDAWSPAAKAKFATLDPEIQAEIARREVEVHKGFTKQDEQRNTGKQFLDVVTPYLPLIRSEGGNPIAAVQDLLQTAYTLRTANSEVKQDLFIRLAGQFGVDMQGVFNRLSGQQQQNPVHPQVMQLQQQLAELQRERQAQQQAVQATETAQIQSSIEAFAADPKNVYFANVKPEMAALLNEGRAKDLQEAYDMACWARPDIRPLLLQQQEQQKRAEAQAKATRARQAGASVSGSPSGASAPGAVDPNASLRETIRAAMRESQSAL